MPSKPDAVQLASAAPDMLRACINALDAIRTIARRPDPDMEEEIVAELRAAIAKAVRHG